MKTITLTAILLLSFGLELQANLLVVDNAQAFKSALADSVTADSIVLATGIYSGQFEISLPQVILGEPGSVIDGQGFGNVLSVTADSVALRGLAVQNSGTRLLKDHAGILVTGKDIQIIDCTVRDNLHGIYVKAGSNVEIRHNTIIGRDYIQEADRGNGIHLWNTRGNIIVDNDISYARDGIYFSFAHQTRVVENHIHHLRYGLHYMYSDTNSFEYNLFDYNVAGGALMFSKHISFQHNVFAHCRGMRAYGILLQSVDYCIAENNLILDNTKAIFFDDANYNRLVLNDIVQNDLAIHINASCEENIIVCNNFLSNLSEVIMDPSITSRTHWHEDGRGNYWSAYKGFDLDGNGVGDRPYQLQSVFEYMEMDNPAVRFYLHSPASHLLAAAERRLPILRKSTGEDEYPLYRPAKNDSIPWQLTAGASANSSTVHLVFWAVGFLALPGLLWRMRA